LKKERSLAASAEAGGTMKGGLKTKNAPMVKASMGSQSSAWRILDFSTGKSVFQKMM
jgi:hypothetical protein